MSLARTADVAILETREASPSHYLMRVESFPLLAKNEIPKYESGVFTAGGYKWKLILYPNEDKSGTDGKYVSVYLAISDTQSLQPANWEVTAVFSIFLLNQISGNYHYSSARTRRFTAMKLEWGISNFISKKDLMDPSNGFLMEDNCVFGAEVFIVEKSALHECLSVKNVIAPHKRNWEISNFSKVGEIWTSEEFVVGGVNWQVTLYPRGSGAAKGSHLSAYLRLMDSKRKRVNASFSICIRDRINNNTISKGTEDSHWFSPSNSWGWDWFSPTLSNSWGWHSLIELSTLEDPKKGFIIKDCCLLELEISVLAVV